MGLRIAAILGRMGFQSELHFGSTIRPIYGRVSDVDGCLLSQVQVGSGWKGLRMLTSFKAILCPVVREW